MHGLARDQTHRFAGRPVRITSPQGPFAAGAALLNGRVLDGVTAHGKHLFAAFGEHVAHVHLGLFGKYLAGTGTPPPPRGAVRMRWVGQEHWTDLSGATACEVLDPGEVTSILARLGPDPLRPRARGDAAYARIARSRVPIAGLLMDQTVLAGVGNVYRAEILFRHQIPPCLAGRDLTEQRWLGLWSDLARLMRAGLRSGRIVSTRPLDRDHRRGPVHAEDAHYVYRRTGLPCRVCGSPIAMQLLQARKLYWCPTCQS